MKRLFVLTPQAKADVHEILLNIATDSPKTAERLRFQLYQGFQRLSRSPGIGNFRDDLMSRKYRFWNFYSYVVCYAWKPRPIQVVAVVHGLATSARSSACGQINYRAYASKPARKGLAFLKKQRTIAWGG